MLPEFRYHPDPIGTGNVAASDKVCRCCGEPRGYIYKASVYCRERLQDALCQWCIADGSAARKFEARFSDDAPLADAGVADEVIEEVTRRTPGYVSWQQEHWLSCCDDACEFHGDATNRELVDLEGKALEYLCAENEIDRKWWKEVLKGYEPGGGTAVYKFRCRHCGRVRYGLDFT